MKIRKLRKMTQSKMRRKKKFMWAVEKMLKRIRVAYNQMGSALQQVYEKARNERKLQQEGT